MINFDKYNQRGAVAVISLMVISAFSLIVISTVSITATNNLKMSRSDLETEQTFFAAEAGINEALYRLVKHPIPGHFTLDINGINVDVTVQPHGHDRIITSVAEDNSGKIRRLRILANSSAFAGGFDYAVQTGQGGLEMMNNSDIIGDVYSNGSIFGNNPATPKAEIDGDVTIAAGTPTISGPEQILWDTNLAIADIENETDVAQSFIMPSNEPLKKIKLNISRSGTLPGDIKIGIANDVAGSPSDELIIEKIISKNDVPSTLADPNDESTWFEVEFEIGPLLDAGNTYWIIIDSVVNDPSRYLIWGYNSVGTGYIDGEAKHVKDYSLGGWQTLTGDFQFQTNIGIGTTYAKNLKVNKDLEAESIINCSVDGIETIGSPDKKPFPLTQDDIDNWKNEAGGGTEYNANPSTGNYEISSVVNIGPAKINGNLVLTGSANVTLTGNLWVTGDIIFQDPNIPMQLDLSYADGSGVIISDGHIDMKNNANLSGSGDINSFLLVISTHNSLNKNNPAIYARNNSNAALFYASKGMVIQYNGTNLNSTTGYYVVLEENSTVTFNPNLIGFYVPSGDDEEVDPIADSWEEL